MTQAPPPKGLLVAATALLKTVIAIAHTRLQMLALDLEEDRLYLLQIVKLMLLTVFYMATSIILLTVFTVTLFWENHRLLVLLLLAAGFFLAALLSWWCTLNRVRLKPALFSASLAELNKDWQATQSPERDT